MNQDKDTGDFRTMCWNVISSSLFFFNMCTLPLLFKWNFENFNLTPDFVPFILLASQGLEMYVVCYMEIYMDTAGSCPAFHSPVPPSLSPQGCSQSVLHPACLCAWDCPDPGTGPCTWPCWTSWGSHGPTSQACSGPSGRHPIPPVRQPRHTAWCCQCQILFQSCHPQNDSFM